MLRGLAPFVMVFTLAISPIAQADEMKLFIKSCTYGILAGTLVGAATLAFTSQPGENLNNIARGASLGLYTGMIIGYLAIRTPSEDTPEGPGPDSETTEEDEPEGAWMPRLGPHLSQRGLDGAQVQWVFRF